MYICTDCKKEFDSFKKLQIHNSKIHKIPAGKSYVDVYLNGTWPVCKCGCNEKLNFQVGKFGEYIRGHAARVNGGFYSAEGAKKSGQTRKQKFASGELEQWNKGRKLTEGELIKFQEVAKDPERRKKISEGLKGKQKSPEHVAKITADRKKYWGEQLHRDEQRARRVKYMTAHLIKAESKLEKEFKNLLSTLKIEYIFQYVVEDYNYDFFIPSKNLLIEVDGDWWHCNPELNIIPIHNSQKHTVEHDRIKNAIAMKNNYQLHRFWENDIVNNRFEVVGKLMEILKH
jgi:very-short-patch-repair endonuclease